MSTDTAKKRNCTKYLDSGFSRVDTNDDSLVALGDDDATSTLLALQHLEEARGVRSHVASESPYFRVAAKSNVLDAGSLKKAAILRLESSPAYTPSDHQRAGRWHP